MVEHLASLFVACVSQEPTLRAVGSARVSNAILELLQMGLASVHVNYVLLVPLDQYLLLAYALSVIKEPIP